MKFATASVSLLAVVPSVLAVNIKGTITVQNIAPEGGTFQTPLWAGIHDGTFDVYDGGASADGFPGLELLAEDGGTSGITTRFEEEGGAWDGTTPGGPFTSGEERSIDFDLDTDEPLYFSYASMILPSNDAFIANGNPKTHLLYSAGEGFNLKFVVKGSEALDAGTEVNTESGTDTAGIPGFTQFAGEAENGVVTPHGGFIPGGNILTNFAPNGNFLEPGYKLIIIIVIIKEIDGEPGPVGFGAGGDPHFRRWDRSYFDFHGACDLILLKAKQFAESMDLNVHIRTKLRYDYSFIESAVVQLGDETFEVASFGENMLNGVSNVDPSALELAGFPIVYSHPSEKVHKFEIQISDHETIELTAFKDMVSVTFNGAEKERFNGSYGMMGGFDEHGAMVGRDGKTVFEDVVEFAHEWQVDPEEDGMLFQTVKAPQHPAQCVMPTAAIKESRARRRLGASLSMEMAEQACAKAGRDQGTRAACVRDVLATGDLDLADAGAF